MLSGGGAAIAVIAFFLPWISVSCDVASSPRNSRLAEFSGFDLASGPKLQTPFGIQQGDPTPLLWLVLVGAVAAVCCALLIKSSGSAAITVLCSAAIGLAPLFITWVSNPNAQRSTSGANLVRVSMEAGLWLTLFGLASALATSVVVLLAAAAAEQPSPNPWPQSD
jgi:hypothetical protein